MECVESITIQTSIVENTGAWDLVYGFVTTFLLDKWKVHYGRSIWNAVIATNPLLTIVEETCVGKIVLVGRLHNWCVVPAASFEDFYL